MTQSFDVQHVSVTIHRRPQAVYDFIANGENLAKWASGLGHSVQLEDGAWVAEGPLGRVHVRFVASNLFGVLDHDVTLASGETVRNPLRVLANGQGSELVFSLFRLPGVSVEKFEQDAQWVAHDLGVVKGLLEQAASH